MVIQEGSYYKIANGTVRGPAKKSKRRPLYPWVLGSTYYTNEGKFLRFLSHEEDIIEEILPITDVTGEKK